MKRIIFSIILVVLIVININVNANEVSTAGFHICETEALFTFKIIGIVIFIIKILAPLIIIVLTAVDLGKTALTGDEKEMKSTVSVFIKRFLAGVLIFFIPTIVLLIVNLLGNFSTGISRFEDCTSCILDPYGDDCNEGTDNFCINNENSMVCQEDR